MPCPCRGRSGRRARRVPRVAAGGCSESRRWRAAPAITFWTASPVASRRGRRARARGLRCLAACRSAGCRKVAWPAGSWSRPGALLAGGCAPEIFAMSVGNPARGGNAAGAMQSYEVPPYRQDHRYEATLEGWTPSSLGLPHPPGERRSLRPAVELRVRAGRRSRPALPVRGGRRRPGAHRDRAPGRHAARRRDRRRLPHHGRRRHPFVVLQIRPVADRGCTAVDFRWDFQA